MLRPENQSMLLLMESHGLEMEDRLKNAIYTYPRLSLFKEESER